MKKKSDLKPLNSSVHTKNYHHIPQNHVFISAQDALLSKIKSNPFQQTYLPATINTCVISQDVLQDRAAERMRFDITWSGL